MPVILIVDDDSSHRELAGRYLKRLPNLTIVEAEDGQKALERISAQAPDLVLTDLRMPGMDGLRLVERAHGEFPFLPIIVMTSYGSEQIAVRALTAGAVSYVSKKDLEQTLAGTVEEVLEIAQSRKLQGQVLAHHRGCETQFELENDPELITPLVGFLVDDLRRLGFGDETLMTQMGMALMESLTNAMFHGNLEVSSRLRQHTSDAFYELARRRRTEEPYASRKVHVRANVSPQQVVYTIRDEGPGFDPSGLPDPTAPENMVRLCGRGLLLIRTFMDEVRHDARGNEISLIKRSPATAGRASSAPAVPAPESRSSR